MAAGQKIETPGRSKVGFIVRVSVSVRSKFPKMEDFLHRTPINHRAKFDAAIALSSAEKSVTVQTHKKQTNKQ